MVITADTGLMAKLYLVEPNSPQALAAIQTVAPPLLVTGWHLLEMSNCFQRAVFDNRITSAQAQQCEEEFLADQQAGLFLVSEVDHARVLRRARSLTLAHTPAIGTRALDLIHVAFALELEADTFLSFDDRQRKAAQAEGLIVLP